MTKEELTSKKEWIIKQHKDTNHKYDEYLEYEFHLRMVVESAKKYLELLPDSNDGEESFRDGVILGAWGHDLIEDTRVSYNDVKERLGYNAAEIIYAVSNEKGKTRKERANDKYYEGIRNTPGAVFVKLCDRIANVQYSKMTGSRMFEMYKKENDNFLNSLGFVEGQAHPLGEMCHYLETLFND
jgi:(p)ppGpp synthase/HD superfamily hydrolase